MQRAPLPGPARLRVLRQINDTLNSISLHIFMTLLQLHGHVVMHSPGRVRIPRRRKKKEERKREKEKRKKKQIKTHPRFSRTSTALTAPGPPTTPAPAAYLSSMPGLTNGHPQRFSVSEDGTRRWKGRCESADAEFRCGLAQARSQDEEGVVSQSQPSVFFPSDQRLASMRTPFLRSRHTTHAYVSNLKTRTHKVPRPPSCPVLYRIVCASCVVRRASYVVCVEGTAPQVSAAMQCLQEEEEK